jgi:hypothetical protein
VARLLNNTEFACLNAFGYPFSSGSYTYGFGCNALVTSCKNGAVCGIFIGGNSGRNINSASRVIAIGNNAIGRSTASNKTGLTDLVMIGAEAMVCFNCSSSFTTSVGIGFEVFKSSIDTPSCNVAIGFRSMYSLGQPTREVSIGSYSGRTLAGSRNVIIGHCAGESLEDGELNLFIGHIASRNIPGSSSRNVMIGYCAGYLSYAHCGIISIGHGSTTSAYDFHTSFGNSSTTFNKVGAKSWTVLSDRYDKTDILDLPDDLGLNFIRKLKPVKYKLDPRDRYVQNCGFEFGQKDHTLANEKESYGFLAQDIEESINELGSRFDAVSRDEFTDSYRLTTSDLIAPVIKSLKQTLDRLEIIENKLKDN